MYKFIAVSALLLVSAYAEVPMGREVVSGDLSAIVTAFGDVPALLAPWAAPPELRQHGVMVSLRSTGGATPAKVLVSAVLETKDGSIRPYSTLETWQPNQSGYSTVWLKTDSTPVKVLKLNVSLISSDQVHSF